MKLNMDNGEYVTTQRTSKQIKGKWLLGKAIYYVFFPVAIFFFACFLVSGDWRFLFGFLPAIVGGSIAKYAEWQRWWHHD